MMHKELAVGQTKPRNNGNGYLPLPTLALIKCHNLGRKLKSKSEQLCTSSCKMPFILLACARQWHCSVPCLWLPGSKNLCMLLGVCDEDIAACFCNGTYGRVPAPVFSLPGAPPVKMGRPMILDNCQPNHDDFGNPTPWGAADPEDLFGPDGWCEAAKPRKRCAVRYCEDKWGPRNWALPKISLCGRSLYALMHWLSAACWRF